MNPRLLTTCLILGALVAPALARAADGDRDRKHLAAFVEDSVITTKIKAKLANDKMSSLTRIKVDTDNKGAVALGGTVTTQEQADRALALARGTEGVTGVKSAIQVRKDD